MDIKLLYRMPSAVITATVDQNDWATLSALILYMLVIIGIGVFYRQRANKSSEDFFIGGRTLGPWISALSAEASDMSGWLLMGLPGVAYWSGLSDAAWTAIGLAIGTYLNWLIVAKRLRVYSIVAGDAITVPDYISQRFKEKKPLLMSFAALFILVFFTVYAASCFVTIGKLFATLFGTPYILMVIIGAVFVVSYTFLGGFLAESVSDFMQAIVMIISLIVTLYLAVSHAGGVSQVVENVKQIPGFFEFFGIATPVVENGVQTVQNGVPLFGAADPYSFLVIISTMSWGLGYFGMPQVLLRFIGIRSNEEIKQARRIATVWCVIALFVAVSIGIAGRVVFPTALASAAQAESIFIIVAQRFLPPFIAGIILAGILAATISSSDSYLLIASSAVAKNFYQHVFKKDATDKQVMQVSRIVLLLITVVATIIALDENSIIFQIVSFAWAGFGATFGPVILTSVLWRRVTRQGALAGMLVGGGMVFVWKLILRPMGGVLGIYELGPAFLLSLIAIVVVSLLTRPDEAVLAQHDDYLKQFKAN